MWRGEFTVIAAVNQENWEIGRNGSLPWNVPEDLRHFAKVTKEVPAGSGSINALIMGHNTFRSIGKCLPGRLTIVLTRNPDLLQQPEHEQQQEQQRPVYVSSFEAALSYCKSPSAAIYRVFVIGGESVFREALQHSHCKDVVLTTVVGNNLCQEGVWGFPQKREEGSAYFPIIDLLRRFQCIQKDDDDDYSLLESSVKPWRYRVDHFIRADTLRELLPPFWFAAVTDDTATAKTASLPINPEEDKYLQLVSQILETGEHKVDRTNVGTLSVFGPQLSFSLKDGVLPLLTTKKVFHKRVIEELLWFIKGSTNSLELSSKGNKIWDGNSSREFLDKRGLTHREVGDLGPVYGFQWRHFGATYEDMHADYSGKGIDQLANCIRLIRENPEDRRIIMTAWNPAQLHEMALPPCHLLCQFHVGGGSDDGTGKRTLNCKMYQRSADLLLGVPFNIASYAFLTCMIAYLCGMEPGMLILTFGDTHLYKTHLEGARMQIGREPREFPKLRFARPVEEIRSIDDFVESDFVVEGYDPHPYISLPMAV